MSDYSDLPALRGFVLEESWVLTITCMPGLVEFNMELVLSRDHPQLRPARPGEAFDIRAGRLVFEGVDELIWSRQGSFPATDASGEVDWGHIDSLTWNDGRFDLEGDWGKMRLDARTVRVDLD